MKKFIKYFFTVAILGSMVVFQACGPDEGPDALKPDARFNSTQDATNPLKFTFENVSLNATSYSWDFGDGETSTDENPTHTYAAAKIYTVNLTATGDGGTHQRSAEVDTRTPLNKLAGDGTAPKLWKMVREGEAILQENHVVGEDWNKEWNLSDASDAGAQFDKRACLLTDEFYLSTDGKFEYKTGGSYWSNPALKSSWGCQEDATPIESPSGEDFSAWGSGIHSFVYDVDNDTLKVIGVGAHFGIFNKTHEGSEAAPRDEIIYFINKVEDVENGVDTLRISVTYPYVFNDQAKERRFVYTYVSYDNANDEPTIPGPKPTAKFTTDVNGLEVTFTNTSTFADSYVWDFGDGTTSTDESPVHTYAAEGMYLVKLETVNADGMDETAKDTQLGGVTTFTKENLTGGAGSSKTWVLRSAPGALWVGPEDLSATWWNNGMAEVTDRACLFNDEYTFTHDSDEFVFDLVDDVYASSKWEAGSDVGCFDASAYDFKNENGDDISAWGNGTFGFEVTGDAPATIKVIGDGAHIGMAFAANGSEVDKPVADITYEVVNYIQGTDKDYLIILVKYTTGNGTAAAWRWTLETK